MDFFFKEWPNGLGPAVVQVGMMVAGSALGIKLVDDYRSLRTAIGTRKPRG